MYGQRYLSEYDSTLFLRDTVRNYLKRMENLHFSGYIQPQFQRAGSKGARSFEGGDFADSSNNRFLLRRARIKVDYLLPARNREFPLAVFTFQFDITERGAFARDVFFRLFEPKHHKLSITMGLFARPYGYEVNLASSVRESPERGRMSQILMPAERDLGAMLSYESKGAPPRRVQLKWDAGLFNGQGLSGTTDFDSYKDIIGRLRMKPLQVSKRFSVAAGLSLLYGGWLQATRYRFQTFKEGGLSVVRVDSSVSNAGSRAPRHYYGGDVQIVYKHGWGKTELRAEYWQGKQPGTANSTINPGSLPLVPTYIRRFNGGFFYFIQSLGNETWEAVLKADWYDPNLRVAGRAINAPAFTAADVKYLTFGGGLTHYVNRNFKAVVYYNLVRNETTSLPAYMRDREDDVFTFRVQLNF